MDIIVAVILIAVASTVAIVMGFSWAMVNWVFPARTDRCLIGRTVATLLGVMGAVYGVSLGLMVMTM